MEDHEIFEVEVNSLEEARHIGSLRWSVDPSDLQLEVIEEGKRLFGILGKKMRVSISRGNPSGKTLNPGFIEGLISRMELSVEPVVLEDGTIDLSGDDSGIVIGKYGETLKAMEFLTNLVVRDTMPDSRIRLDSDGYRIRRQESVEKIAEAAAREALRKGRSIRLEPMSSWERRIVHITLKDRDDVTTSSTGVEPMRRVEISPCRNAARGH